MAFASMRTSVMVGIFVGIFFFFFFFPGVGGVAYPSRRDRPFANLAARFTVRPVARNSLSEEVGERESPTMPKEQLPRDTPRVAFIFRFWFWIWCCRRRRRRGVVLFRVVSLPFFSILIWIFFFFFFLSDRAIAVLNRSAFLDATVFASKESFANRVRNAMTMASVRA